MSYFKYLEPEEARDDVEAKINIIKEMASNCLSKDNHKAVIDAADGLGGLISDLAFRLIQEVETNAELQLQLSAAALHIDANENLKEAISRTHSIIAFIQTCNICSRIRHKT